MVVDRHLNVRRGLNTRMSFQEYCSSSIGPYVAAGYDCQCDSVEGYVFCDKAEDGDFHLIFWHTMALLRLIVSVFTVFVTRKIVRRRAMFVLPSQKIPWDRTVYFLILRSIILNVVLVRSVLSLVLSMRLI